MEISSLEGYESLRQKIKDAIKVMHSEEPAWIFENEKSINLNELAGDSGRHTQSKGQNGERELSGREQLEKIIGGKVFEFEDFLFEQDVDSNYLLDEKWFSDALEETLEKRIYDDFSAFAEMHDIDEDDLTEFIENDDEITCSEVFDYGLHSFKFEYQGSAPAELDLNCQISLRPCLDTALALNVLKIAPEDWIQAVSKWSKENEPEDEKSVFMSDDDCFNQDDYRKKLGEQIENLTSSIPVFFFPKDNQLVSPYDLIEKMVNVWDVTSTELMLRFNIDGNYVDNISKPVNRILESHEVDRIPIEISNFEICPKEDPDNGDGIITLKSYKCTIGEISLSGSESEERADISASLNGAMGVLIRTYEIILKNEQSQEIFSLSKNKNSSADGIPDEISEELRNSFKDLNRFEAEKLQAKYPGLTKLFPEYLNSDSIDKNNLSNNLIKILSENISCNRRHWGKSEAREYSSWLVQQGADLSARLNNQKSSPMAMHLAASLEDFDLLRLMADHGADLSAKYKLTNATDGHDKGLWEIIASRALIYKKTHYSCDIGEHIDAIKFVEYGGATPFAGPLHITDEYKPSLHKAIILLGDSPLAENHIARMLDSDNKKQIDFALYVGMMEDNFDFSKLCMDAGARTSHLMTDFGSLTIENAARSELKSWVENSAIDKSVSYCQALLAKEEIESLLSAHQAKNSLCF